jgi:hypothetical protein
MMYITVYSVTMTLAPCAKLKITPSRGHDNGHKCNKSV